MTGAKAAAAGPPDSGPDDPILIGALDRRVGPIGVDAVVGVDGPPGVGPARAPVAPVPWGGPVLCVAPVAAVGVAVVFDGAVVPSVPADVVGAPVPAGAAVPAVLSSLPRGCDEGGGGESGE